MAIPTSSRRRHPRLGRPERVGTLPAGPGVCLSGRPAIPLAREKRRTDGLDIPIVKAGARQ